MNALPVSARHMLVLTAGPRGVSQYFSYSSSKYILLVEAVKKNSNSLCLLDLKIHVLVWLSGNTMVTLILCCYCLF